MSIELDRLSDFSGQVFTRLFFGCELKPCDWVYWDDDKQCWFENDEHFRERIKNSLNNT